MKVGHLLVLYRSKMLMVDQQTTIITLIDTNKKQSDKEEE